MSKSHQTNNHAPDRTTLQIIALVYVILHGFLFWVTANSMPVVDSSFTRILSPNLVLTLIGLASLASLIAGVAMWFWKRWGLYLYVIATIVLGGAMLLKTGSIIMLFGALLPVIIVLYIFSSAFKYFK